MDAVRYVAASAPAEENAFSQVRVAWVRAG
jgi:hypothetical protein